MTKPGLTQTLALVLTLALAGNAAGQQEKGDNEIQIQGSLNLDLGGDAEDSGVVIFNWGRFFTDNQEAGLTLLTNFDSSGDLAGIGGPFWRMNFGSGKRVPFIGVAATTNFSDSDVSSDFLLTLEGGMRWFLERNLAFSLSGRTNYDIDRSDFDDRLQVLFGFSYFWRK